MDSVETVALPQTAPDRHCGSRAHDEAFWLSVKSFFERAISGQALRGTDEQGELVQICLVTAFENVDDYHGETAPAFHSWLKAIVRTRFQNSQRERRQRCRFQDDSVAAFQHEDPRSSFDPALLDLRNATCLLAPLDRQLLDLLFWQGLSNRGCARVLHVSEGTIRWQLARILCGLRNLLGGPLASYYLSFPSAPRAPLGSDVSQKKKKPTHAGVERCP
jgi:RNA polymerase sigma factor (sigma-70 family)